MALFQAIQMKTQRQRGNNVKKYQEKLCSVFKPFPSERKASGFDLITGNVFQELSTKCCKSITYTGSFKKHLPSLVGRNRATVGK